MKLTQLVRTLSLFTVALALTACSKPLGERMGEALSVVRGFQNSDHPIPTLVFENAKGIAILREDSGALIIGGAGGEGIFMKRAGLSWSAPVAVNTGSASIGLQAGGQSRDIIIVMNTDNEVSNFLDSGLYGLAEASAVAGPAKTDPYNAGGPVPATYYYIRSKGLFGGLLLGGVHFSISDKVNHETYGDSATIGDILRDKYPAPAGASVLWQSLN